MNGVNSVPVKPINLVLDGQETTREFLAIEAFSSKILICLEILIFELSDSFLEIYNTSLVT